MRGFTLPYLGFFIYRDNGTTLIKQQFTVFQSFLKKLILMLF